MRKILIVICSYNTKEYTRRIYEEISQSSLVDVIIVDNSSEEKEIPDFGVCHHIGFENVEFGGMHDYILNLPLISEYKFVGIFNNDIFGFTNNDSKMQSTECQISADVWCLIRNNIANDSGVWVRSLPPS